MSDAIASANATETTEAPKVWNPVRAYTYNFRKVTPKDVEDIATGIDGVSPDSIRAEFEAVKKKDATDKDTLRRRSVKVELTLPDWCESIPELAQGVVLDFIADYCKAMYVDAFQPIGSHTWAEIEAFAANRGTGGRRAEFDIADDLLALAAASIGDYMAVKLSNKTAGEKFKAAVMGKYARSAIHRNIGEFSEQILRKMQAHLDGWLEHIAVNDADNADAFSDVYNMLAAKLKAHLGASSEVSPAQLLLG